MRISSIRGESASRRYVFVGRFKRNTLIAQHGAPTNVYHITRRVHTRAAGYDTTMTRAHAEYTRSHNIIRAFVSARNASPINQISSSRLKPRVRVAVPPRPAQVASNPCIMDEIIELTLEGLQAKARKTNESSPRVAVYDVIAMVKRCDNNYAGQIYMRLMKAGKVPECEEVEQELVPASCMNQDSSIWGGNRKPVRVASASEMVQILMQLPGETIFKQNCADVIVRYLGGDTSLVADVIANRAEQERLADEDPDHPVRMMGEEVEARGTKRGFDEAVGAAIERSFDRGLARFADALEKGIQSGIERATQANAQAAASIYKELHAWDFSRPGRDRRLEDLGMRVEGAELERLEEDEGVVRSSDFLEARFPAEVWRVFKNKFNNLFRRRLKEAKLAENTKRPVYTCRNQGGIRIVYTRNDIILMNAVFEQCEGNFKRISSRDQGRQRLITDYAQETELQEVADDCL